MQIDNNIKGEEKKLAKRAFPYIPNSVEEIKAELLEDIGISDVEDIFKEIPDHLRFDGKLNIPEPKLSEYELKKHVERILSKNKSAQDNLNFKGGGVWQHYVPSVCRTIAGRDEFLTAYVGDAYADHGKFQALFETASMIGELVEMDAVNTPTYDWSNAIVRSIRMAARINGRKEVLIPASMSPSRKKVVLNYCKPDIKVTEIDFDPETALLKMDDLKAKLSEKVSSVYIENPNYLGYLELKAEKIGELAHQYGAEFIVGVDPSSLGVLEAPANYGADLVCGELQPFGLNMKWGGALSGFIASPDEEKYVGEYPSLLFGITPTVEEGEYGFGHVAFERTSYAQREKGKDFIGTSTALYGIIAGVYLALIGPKGLIELGEGIMQRCEYAKEKFAEIEGVSIPIQTPSFKEFVVDFSGCSKSVKEINQLLEEENIFGGIELGEKMEEYQNCALFCFTEVHDRYDINKLINSIEMIIEKY